MRNQTIMQYFEWYLPSDQNHWKHLKEDSQHLADIGITKVWMPPAFKGTGKDDVGYGVYDLFDLGEFDQKGTIATKYGTKDEYLDAIKALKNVGIFPIADVVLNHKANGDGLETFKVLRMDPNDRQTPISEPFEIEAWTHFKFPGRGNTYSDFKWHWYHFSGTDFDAKNQESGVYMILGDNKGWADNETVDSENGNYDYLMFTDIDYGHPDVLAHTHDWMDWFVKTTGVAGFRLDAIKHIDQNVMKDLMQHAKEHYGESFYVFGEYWNSDFDAKDSYLNETEFTFDLVDVALHMNFYQAGLAGGYYDLRNLFQGTLIEHIPTSAVTFVENHDTQRGQALESAIEDWFKPIAYGVILLREQGLPCVFYGDYYGIEGEFGQPSFQNIIDKFLYIRQNHAYGEQIDYLDDANCIGWTRLGNDEHPDGVAVIISNGDINEKRMHVGTLNAGKVFVDYTGNHDFEVVIDDEGWGMFPVNGGSISAWVNKDC
ncbi:alpha-amylase [Streptococcus moroccensis]|uniref:Alpha-amylase n=1 Tax=Streptococcus moroccensis TaxID=1451356 RepID=A0ABT9YQD5_9STRE|nr:alpha-amylase [Streptococcus moroccensis]MDQ0222206.1 alpha-amylase [Streptococcus moroccensis]